jgi:sugar porter (SP) family MFS transporter
MTINSHVIRSTVVGALGGLLFGFDTSVISGTTSALTHTYHLSPALLGVTVSSALVGTVIGAMAAGIPGQRLGRRDSLRVMAIFYIISALGCALAWNWPALIFFRFIGGMGIGGSSVLGPMYIAEIAPAEWRGRLVGCFQVNIVVGVLLAYMSNAVIDMMRFGTIEWRLQLGISGVPAVLFLVALFGIPRSPRWLVMKFKFDETMEVLRLTGVSQPREELAEIVASLHQERDASADSLFSRQYRFPVFLAITVGMFCQLSGINAVLYYLNDIFAMAGATKVSGDLQSVAVGVTILVATLAAMLVIDQFGRRKLLMVGTVGLTLCLTAISYVFMTRRHLSWIVWLLMAYIACFAISQGAVVWVYISEVFPNRVRAKGQALGSSSHWVTNAIISLIFPILATSSGAYPFIFFGAMMVVDFFLVLKYYPETKGIALEQIELADR